MPRVYGSYKVGALGMGIFKVLFQRFVMVLAPVSHHAINFDIEQLSVFVGGRCKATEQHPAIEGNKGNRDARCITVGRRSVFGIMFLFSEF